MKEQERASRRAGKVLGGLVRSSIGCALGGVLLVSHPLAAATFTVGADGGSCDFDTISGALLGTILNGPSLDVIRIANDQSYPDQNLVISNQSVSLVGGYASCTDTVGGSTTTLDGTGAPSAPVITISGTTNGTRSVELVGLEITNGELSGVDISGSNIVSIQRSIITGNTAPHGGGIHLDGSDGAILTLDESSSVIGNTATDTSGQGGGIYCSQATLILNGLVATNSAWFGGGVFSLGCTVNDFAGGFLRGVHQNTGVFGGGIGAFNGSVVNLVGSSSHPAVVSDNIASGNGGGLYVSFSSVIATDSWITGNQAEKGGGVAVDDGEGSFVMHRTMGAECHDAERCSEISGNTATLDEGGALYARGGGTIEVRQTYLEGNTAYFGAVAYIEGTGTNPTSTLFLEGDALGHNHGDYMLYLISGAEFTASYVTSASNSPLSSQTAFYGNGSAEDTARIYSSIIADTLVYGAGVNGATHIFNRLVAANTFGLPASGTVVLEADPQLRNAAAGDYALKGSSVGIDFSDNAAFPATDLDLHNNPRGVDQTWKVDYLGPWDVGALESDIVFFSGFESGSTSEWSADAP